jgi:hypothetical protein
MQDLDERLSRELELRIPSIEVEALFRSLEERRRRKRIRRKLGSAALAIVVLAGSIGGFAVLSHTFSWDKAGPAASNVVPNPGRYDAVVKAKRGAVLKGFTPDPVSLPANVPTTVLFLNLDPGIPHDFEIFSGPKATRALFKGTIITGPSNAIYQIPALPAGTYQLRDIVHPITTTATLVVGRGGPSSSP